MNYTKEIVDFNYSRNKLHLDIDLEARMFSEETNEFMTSLLEKDLVGMIDAYCDSVYVLSGSKFKILSRLFNDVHEMNAAYTYVRNATEMCHYMNSILVTDYNVKSGDLLVAFNYVVEANSHKEMEGTTGKIKKGSKWKDPKEKIAKLLMASSAK